MNYDSSALNDTPDQHSSIVMSSAALTEANDHHLPLKAVPYVRDTLSFIQNCCSVNHCSSNHEAIEDLQADTAPKIGHYDFSPFQ